MLIRVHEEANPCIPEESKDYLAKWSFQYRPGILQLPSTPAETLSTIKREVEQPIFLVCLPVYFVISFSDLWGMFEVNNWKSAAFRNEQTMMSSLLLCSKFLSASGL